MCRPHRGVRRRTARAGPRHERHGQPGVGGAPAHVLPRRAGREAREPAAHHAAPRGQRARRILRSAGVRAAPRAPPRPQRPRRGRHSRIRLSHVSPAGQCTRREWSWFTLRIEDGAVSGGSVRLPGAVTKNKKPLPLALTGHLLALVARRWALRVPECPYVFHRDGRPIRDFRATWVAACKAVGLSGLLFHDLRRSGARNYRRAGVTEDVIMRIGGWKTASMFRRYNVVDERDLTEAAERLTGFLTDAASAPPTIVPLPAARTIRSGSEWLRNTSIGRQHGQNTDSQGPADVASVGSTAVSY